MLLRDSEPLAGELTRYLKEYPDAKDLKASKDIGELINQPVNSSLLALYFGVADLITEKDDWVLVGSDRPGILEKAIRPALRSAKNPGLNDTWDFQYKLLEEEAKSSRNPVKLTRFERIQAPRLLFSKAEDVALLGQTVPAAEQILVLMERYPAHPDFLRWEKKVRELLVSPGAP